MTHMRIEAMDWPPTAAQSVEFVERKGIGQIQDVAAQQIAGIRDLWTGFIAGRYRIA